eukprot:gene12786-biopygen9378
MRYAFDVGAYHHSPFPSATFFTSLCRLRSSHYSISSNVISTSERRALRRHLRESGQLGDVTTPEQLIQDVARGDSLMLGDRMNSVPEQFFLEEEIPGCFNVSGFCDDFIQLLHIPDMPPLLTGLLTTDLLVFATECLLARQEALATAKRKFVLVSYNHDFSASRSFMRNASRLVEPDIIANHPLLAHWYSIGGDINHPKHTGLPLGFLPLNVPEETPFEDIVTGAQLSLRESTLPKLMIFEEAERKDSYSLRDSQLYFKIFLNNLDLNKVFPHINQPLQYGRSTTIYLEQALELFADDGGTAPADWIPLADLPQRVTTIFVVLVPIPSGPRSASPSLTSEVLVFRDGALAGLGPGAKHVAFLPFTAALYHRLQQHPYGDPNRLPEVVVGFTDHAGRKNVTHYFEEHPILAVDVRSKDVMAHFNATQQYNFMMSPTGNGYDCFRTYEALSLGLIPILLDPNNTQLVYFRGNEDGKDYYQGLPQNTLVDISKLKEVFEDLPVVIIQDMSEVTAENLEKWRGEIHAKMKRGGSTSWRSCLPRTGRA